MHFSNRESLLKNATSDSFRTLRENALEIMEDALDSVDPTIVVKKNVKIKQAVLKIKDRKWNLDEFNNVYVIGGGKASGAMAKAVEELLGDRITKGVINVLEGTEEKYRLKRIKVNGASHPIPNENGVKGVEQMMDLLKHTESSDLVLVLISGGGSALLPHPADGVSLNDLKDVTFKLLNSGATIRELNSVRKHLSAIKGGLLARKAYPSMVVSLILSDVVSDPLDTIASGPTAPDETTFEHAINILKKFAIWDNTPESIKHRLELGIQGKIEETPKKGEQSFKNVHNIVIGNNLEAASMAKISAERLGFDALLLSTKIEGEAREVGREFGEMAKEVIKKNYKVKPPAAIIAGGETTVTVKGSGEGGRNQELALAASMEISGLEVVLIALATDGIDGPTEAAGAIVDGSTIKRAKIMGLNPMDYLDDNDSYSFFNRLGDTLLTGPTGTNVNDLTLILAA